MHFSFMSVSLPPSMYTYIHTAPTKLLLLATRASTSFFLSLYTIKLFGLAGNIRSSSFNSKKMSRKPKIQRLLWTDGFLRRSPRFSGSNDACLNRKLNHVTGNCANLDRSLTDVDQPPVKMANPQEHNQAISTGEPLLPKKHILELILDTLQRRDTYEIFAEPVDPAEVEEYYDIVKDPMDFATMRAKLHEGLYTTLEEFEHDIFLISENAMHFNSSTTIYFRQAKAIHELAKKVFHVLKTDPENFLLEFSGARRRFSRRAPAEVNPNVCPTLSTNFRGRNVGVDSLSGVRYGKRSSSAKADHRCSYGPRRRSSFHIKSGSIFLELAYATEALCPVNQGNITYRESLALFVKDLGPTARMIAGRKLRTFLENATTCSQSPPIFGKSSVSLAMASAAASTRLLKSTTSDTDLIDLTGVDDDDEEEKGAPQEHAVVASWDLNSPAASSVTTTTTTTTCWIDDLNIIPVAENHYQPDISRSELKNKKSSTSSPLGSWSEATTTAAVVAPYNNGSSASAFAFDLPFLKSQLHHMNHHHHNNNFRLSGLPDTTTTSNLDQGWSYGMACAAGTSTHLFFNDQPPSLLHAPDNTNLALQL